MVSTRGVKIKFAEGEKVLCYEPDPSKTKVLYESKVLNIRPTVDKNGKEILEFLIHFQGWSSTWDRIVSEDLLLKDTEKNRHLQKKLALRARLYKKHGNLYRRDTTLQRLRQRLACEHNGNMSAETDSEQSDIEDTSQIVILPLPHSLTKALQYDELYITTQNKVLNLPAEPNIVTILELFLKDYAHSLMKQVSASKKNAISSLAKPASTPSPSFTLDAYCTSVNLCREVVDGIRIYTDVTLPKVLLYRQERGQYHAAVSTGLEREIRFDPDIKIKEEEEDEAFEGMSSPFKGSTTYHNHPGPSVSQPIERKRSLRSHQATSSHNPDTRITRKQSHDLKTTPLHNGSSSIKTDIGRTLSQKESEVLDKILSWNLIPDRVKQEKPTPASLIYGAIHLSRVLLKLPEFIQKSDHSDEKVNLIMDLLTNLLKYLDDHPQWFGEIQYRNNIYPPPPTSEHLH